MAYGIIGYSAPGHPNQPSGSIWGDNSDGELLDEGTGYSIYQDFKAGLPYIIGENAAGTPAVLSANAIVTGTASIAYNTSFSSVLTVTTGAVASQDAMLYTRPLGPIIPNSGEKIWFETSIGLQDITTAKGVFVGLANLASLGAGKLLSAASVTKTSNLIGSSSGGQSVIGFWMHGDAVTDFDIVWANDITTALSPTTIAAPGASATAGGVILAGVLANSQTALTPNPANLNYSNSLNDAGLPLIPASVALDTYNPSAGQAFYGTTYQQRLVLGAQNFIKLGLRYDGSQYVYFYVNGLQVAKFQVTTSFDVTDDFASVVEILPGTAAAEKLDVSFIRASAKVIAD
jgi:hypothetical protein